MDSGLILFFLHTASHLKPWVLEGFSSWDTNVFFAENALDKVFGLIRNIIPSVSIEAVFTLLDPLDDLLVCIAVEGRLTREKDVKDDTYAPHIALLTIGASNYLRSHIVRGTEDAVHGMLIIDTSWSSKINEFDDCVFLVFEVNVLRFDVSMDDIVLVQVVHSGE